MWHRLPACARTGCYRRSKSARIWRRKEGQTGSREPVAGGTTTEAARPVPEAAESQIHGLRQPKRTKATGCAWVEPELARVTAGKARFSAAADTGRMPAPQRVGRLLQRAPSAALGRHPRNGLVARQGRAGLQPRVAAQRLPWDAMDAPARNPNGVGARWGCWGSDRENRWCRVPRRGAVRGQTGRHREKSLARRTFIPLGRRKSRAINPTNRTLLPLSAPNGDPLKGRRLRFWGRLRPRWTGGRT